MEWTSLPKLIEQYRQQIGVIEKRIDSIRQREDDTPIGGQDDIEILCDMRNNLMYSIHLMIQYK